MDHTYESIKALPGLGIYEFRIDDAIGGQDNIRIVYFDPPGGWRPIKVVPLRSIWILEALQKKRQGWTANDIERFRAARTLIRVRCYE